MRSLAMIGLPLLLALAAACAQQPEPAKPLAAEIDAAIVDGAAFLLGRQEEDGAWRSEVYGAFKRGDALTPLALRALLALPPAGRPAVRRMAIERGADYLAAIAPGRDPAGPPVLFAVYTAAQAIEVLSESSDPGHRAARDAWVAELLGRQLTAELGWSEGEAPFGGWGYSTAVPRKPPRGALQPPLLEANTSATVFALQGLHAQGLLSGPAAGPPCAQALLFLERMQNYAEPASAFDDGGFFFIYDDPVRNKAGVAGEDEHGRTRFSSYGSTTADGLRGLLMCGRTIEDPRPRAALTWLENHFVSTGHPGAFTPRLAADRDGLYFYWAASVARTLRRAGIGRELTPTGRPAVRWAEDLARELIARQGAEGAWINPIVTMREDEPIVATSMALLALAEVREVL